MTSLGRGRRRFTQGTNSILAYSLQGDLLIVFLFSAYNFSEFLERNRRIRRVLFETKHIQYHDQVGRQLSDNSRVYLHRGGHEPSNAPSTSNCPWALYGSWHPQT